MDFDPNNLSVAQKQTIIAKFRQSPDGGPIADLLEKTMRGKHNASKKAGMKKAFSSVTSKIQIPEKPLTVEETRRLVHHDIEALSFCRAVAEVLQEMNRQQAHDSSKASSSISSLSVPYYEQLKTTVQGEIDQSKVKISELENLFFSNTDWVLTKQRNESQDSGRAAQGDFGPNFAALTEVLIEREALEKQNLDSSNAARRAKSLKVIQSRIDFRSKKLLEGGGFALHQFVQQVLGQLNQPQLSMVKEKIGALSKTSDSSVQEYLSAAVNISGQCDVSLVAMEHQRAKSRALDEELKTLKERVLKDREKIVKQLNKISFGMRLDQAMETKASVAKKEFCDMILVKIAKERETREATVVEPQIDPATGFEIPYCALSEAQLEAKVKELHAKLVSSWAFMNDFVGQSEMLAERNQTLLAIELPEMLEQVKATRLSVESVYQDVATYVHEESARALQFTTRHFVDIGAAEACLAQSVNFRERIRLSKDSDFKLPDLSALQEAANQASARLTNKDVRATCLVDKINSTLDEVVKMSERESSSSDSDERFLDRMYSAQHPNAPKTYAAGDGRRRGRPVTSTPFTMGHSRNIVPPFDVSDVLNLC